MTKRLLAALMLIGLISLTGCAKTEDAPVVEGEVMEEADTTDAMEEADTMEEATEEEADAMEEATEGEEEADTMEEATEEVEA